MDSSKIPRRGLYARVSSISKWAAFEFLFFGFLGVAGVVVALTVNTDLWHVTPLKINIVSTAQSNALLGSIPPEDLTGALGLLIPGTNFFRSGGYFVGDATTEKYVGGMELLQDPASGERILVLVVSPITATVNNTCDLPALAIKTNTDQCPSHRVGVNTYQPNCTFHVNGSACIEGNLDITGNITFEAIAAMTGGCVPTTECGVNRAPICGLFECTLNSQCNDGFACTNDTCSGGTCLHPTIHGGCQADFDCPTNWRCNVSTCACYDTCGSINCSTSDPIKACNVYSCIDGSCAQLYTVPGCCLNATVCNDNNTCTLDACTGHVCTHTPLGCLADSDCRANFVCNTTNCTCYDSCWNVTCPIDSCNVYECKYGTCAIIATLPGCCSTNIDCNDGNPCTVDFCNQTTHSCLHTPPVSGCATGGDCAVGQFCDGTCTCQTSALPSNSICALLDEPLELYYPFPDVEFGIDAPAIKSRAQADFFDGEFGSSVAFYGSNAVVCAPFNDVIIHYARLGQDWYRKEALYRAANESETDIGVWANAVGMSATYLVVGHCTLGVNNTNSLPAGVGYVSLYQLSGSGTFSWIRDFDNTFIGTQVIGNTTVGPNICVTKIEVYQNTTIAFVESFSNRFFVLENNGTDWVKFQSFVTTATDQGIAIDRFSGNTLAVTSCVPGASNSPQVCQVQAWQRESLGVWTQFQIFFAPTTLNSNWSFIGTTFGRSLSLWNTLLAVGTPDAQFSNLADITGAPRKNSGIVPLYTPGAGGNFTLSTAIYPVRLPNEFGFVVTITATKVFVTAPTDADCTGCAAIGSIYIYVNDAAKNYPLDKRQSPEFTQSLMQYGGAMSASGDEFIVGAPLWGNLGNSDGMAFILSCTT